MKKTLLLLTLFVGTILGAAAQCTPNRADSVHFTSSTLSYPDTVYGIQGTALSGQVVSYKIPQDLPYNAPIVGTISVHIDSMRIDSIIGDPASVLDVSTPSLGTWLHAGDWGCVSFTGTSATAGNYHLTVKGTARFDTSFVVPILGTQTIDTVVSNIPLSTVYPITVKIAPPTGISAVAAGLDLNIFPNPNQGNFTVTISSATTLNGTLSVVDQLGRVLHTQNIDVAGTKEVPLELGNVSPGAYLLVINADGARSVKQFIVK